MDWTPDTVYPALVETHESCYEIKKISPYVLGKNGEDYYRVRFVIIHFPKKDCFPTHSYWETDNGQKVSIQQWKAFS